MEEMDNKLKKGDNVNTFISFWEDAESWHCLSHSPHRLASSSCFHKKQYRLWAFLIVKNYSPHSLSCDGRTELTGVCTFYDLEAN